MLWQSITSAQNPQYKNLLALVGNTRKQKQQGHAFVEGLHTLQSVCEHLQRAGHGAVLRLVQVVVPVALLDNPEWRLAEQALHQVLQQALDMHSSSPSATLHPAVAPRAPVVLWQVPDPLYKKLSTQTTPTGPLLVLRVLPCARPLSTQHDVLVLDGVQDPGNVGTLVRTAAAVGVRQLVCSLDTAWLWSSKALRAGMGAQFAMHCFSEEKLLEALALMPVRITSLAPHPLRAELFQADLTAPGIWVFGHEGQGVRAAWQQRATQHVYIPQSPWVESLNVAASAAVCLYEQWRQRQ